jgi:hypothetical protein
MSLQGAAALAPGGTARIGSSLRPEQIERDQKRVRMQSPSHPTLEAISKIQRPPLLPTLEGMLAMLPAADTLGQVTSNTVARIKGTPGQLSAPGLSKAPPGDAGTTPLRLPVGEVQEYSGMRASCHDVTPGDRGRSWLLPPGEGYRQGAALSRV